MALMLSEQFYDIYKDAGLVPIEIVTNGIIALICFTGITLNMCLVYVTVKTKSLYSSCNILLALFAFFAAFLLVGYSVKFFIFLFGINFIPLGTCFYIQLVPLFGTSFVIMLQLCIGIDRLVGVVCPLWYNSREHWMLFKILIGASSIWSFTNILIVYYGSSLHWNKPVMCSLRDPTAQSETFVLLSAASLIMYCGEFVCYALIWLVTFSRKAPTSESGRRLMVSLSVIMSIGFVCNIANIVFTRKILPYLNLDKNIVECLVFPLCVALFVCAHATPAPVLFMLSDIYRDAFRKHLCIFKKVTTVQCVINQKKVQLVTPIVKNLTTQMAQRDRLN